MIEYIHNVEVETFNKMPDSIKEYVNDRRIVRCKDCKYAFLFDFDDERDGLCGHPNNNAWDIFDEFYCGRGVRNG